MIWEAVLYGAIVGLSLGLTGGGGSIFAVPLLVFGLSMAFRDAVVVSLAVVGLTALYGAVLQSKSGQVLWGAGGILGLGGILLAPVGAKIGVLLPQTVSLLLFAALMLFIGLRMMRKTPAPGQDVPLPVIRCEQDECGLPKFSTLCACKLLVAGGISGILSGIFGVGGGFLLVPALLLVTGIEIGRALATSLVAIFLISASGLVSNLLLVPHWPGWLQPGLFLAGAAVGMTAGAAIKPLFSAAVLRRIFGIAVLLMAVYISLRALGLF
jgi:uncharacterized membrane protein YfcA